MRILYLMMTGESHSAKHIKQELSILDMNPLQLMFNITPLEVDKDLTQINIPLDRLEDLIPLASTPQEPSTSLANKTFTRILIPQSLHPKSLTKQRFTEISRLQPAI